MRKILEEKNYIENIENKEKKRNTDRRREETYLLERRRRKNTKEEQEKEQNYLPNTAEPSDLPVCTSQVQRGILLPQTSRLPFSQDGPTVLETKTAEATVERRVVRLNTTSAIRWTSSLTARGTKYYLFSY